VAQVVEDVTLAPRSPEARMPVRTPLAGGKTTALGGAASNPPGAVFGSDGREHVEYDLVLTNAFSGDATVRSRCAPTTGRRRRSPTTSRRPCR